MKSWLISPKKITMLLLFFAVAMAINGTKSSLDIRFFYTADEADFFLHSLSREVAQRYIRNEWIDIGFMISYSLLFFSLMKKMRPKKQWLMRMTLVPGLFDLIENATILFLLYHEESDSPWWLGIITCLKWTSGFFVVSSLLFAKWTLLKTKS